MINVLNGMNKGAVVNRTLDSDGDPRLPSEASKDAVARIFILAATCVRERRCFDMTGVQLAERLIKRPLEGSYLRSRKQAPQVPLVASALAEPTDSRAVEMLDCLPQEEAEFYRYESNVVKNDVSDILVKEVEQRYGFVGGSEQEYIRYFLREDLPEDLWDFRPLTEARCVVGLSAVPKKNPSQQRKLLMACATNFQWQDASHEHSLGLRGGGMFSSLWTPEGLSLAAFDAESAFTRIRVPLWMRPWLAVPPILSGDLWPKLNSEQRQKFGLNTLIAPQYTRLAMGLSHSVAILMLVIWHSVGRLFERNRQLAAALHSRERTFDQPGLYPVTNVVDLRRLLRLWKQKGTAAVVAAVVEVEGGFDNTLAKIFKSFCNRRRYGRWSS